MARPLLALGLVLSWLALVSGSGRARAAEQIEGLPVVRIPAGDYTPLYRPAPDVTVQRVRAFRLMTRPVTNAEFLAFVARTPELRRDRIARLFADERYLAHWREPLELGAAARPSQPITNVSWFAARAFCEAHGMRLPMEAEWERVAAASRTSRDGSKDAAQRAAIMAWYGQPRGTLPDVPFGPANFFGVHDLHGVAWEWVEDFNDTVIVADSRERGESDRDRFCGAAALVAQDTTDYAAFMRAAMRSSLEANYTGPLLGFRCAADIATKPEAEP